MAFLDYDGLKRFKSWLDATFVKTTAEDMTFEQIQAAVNAGIAPKRFPVGSQLTLKHSVYGDIAMDVVSHDTVKKYGDENAHTMCLMAHDCVVALQYDASEALYYAEAELSAGTYNFTPTVSESGWKAGTAYQFTLANSVPAGGQLCINGTNMEIFSSSSSTTVVESAAITTGSGGTALETLGNVNHIQRALLGSENWKESAMRQWLNSTAAAGSVWTAQTKFDRCPAWATTTDGFLKGCPDGFLSAIATAVVKCASNNSYEAPDSTVTKGKAYEVADKVFLASATEIGMSVSGIVADDSTLFEFFEGASDADRIKYFGGSPAYWWTRTGQTWLSGLTIVKFNGTANGATAKTAQCVVPCVIIA